jgi:hypothetical protein
MFLVAFPALSFFLQNVKVKDIPLLKKARSHKKDEGL